MPPRTDHADQPAAGGSAAATLGSETVDLLRELVAIDTTSRTSNLPLLELVESLFDRAGVVHERVPSPDGAKANLIGRLGPDRDGGVLLTGHTDCVPVDDQPWSRDPFVLHEQDGRLYGRGTTDMKGFLAVVLSALPAMAAADLDRPVQFVFTYDEEVGTVGAPAAVARLVEAWPRPSAVIVGEPTAMEVVTDHKGVRAFTTTVHGRDGHSSQPQFAANAIAAMARIATFVDDLAAEHRDAAADPRFTPPYTTFNLATIHGGTAINIVPRRCELTWEYRPVPDDDSEAILDRVRSHAEEVVLPALRAATGTGDITFRTDASARALAREPDGAAEALARHLAGYDGPARTVPFGTDGGHFQAAELSTVVCGPGSIEQAHQPDEWIELTQLAACQRFVAGLITSLET